MRRIRKDSPEKAAARMERFLASPPARISDARVAARQTKAIRQSRPGRLLEELCQTQRWRCAYCCRQMTRDATKARPGWAATLDHDLPISRGGTNARNNVVAACERCNGEKGATTGAEYRATRALADVPAVEVGNG